MPDYILEAVNVEYKYPDGTKALDNLSLAVEKGRKAAFLGPNGAGKTTLFLHFNGILRPSGGKLVYEGRDLRYDQASLKEIRKKVGIVFQDPDTQLFSASVVQEVSFGPMNLGMPREEVLERVNRAMEDTEISGLKLRPTHFLSEGQKKRVTIADILAMDPAVIIFDEPTACLDPRLKRHVVGLMDRINREGKTVILSTHDVDLAYSWADRVFLIKEGKVAGQGTPEEIFQDQDLVLCSGLEQPWLIDIYSQLRNNGWIDGRTPAPRTKENLLEIIRDNLAPVKSACTGRAAR